MTDFLPDFLPLVLVFLVARPAWATPVMNQMDVIIANVRQKFVEKSEEIVAFKKPWTPWALVALLNIDDSKTDLPAELILYEALRKKRKRLGIAITTAVQVLEIMHCFVQ